MSSPSSSTSTSTSKPGGQPCWAVRQGTLWKEGGFVRSWKQRYFVLYEGGRLAYFADRGSAPASAPAPPPKPQHNSTTEAVVPVPGALGTVDVRGAVARCSAVGHGRSPSPTGGSGGVPPGWRFDVALRGGAGARTYRLMVGDPGPGPDSGDSGDGGERENSPGGGGGESQRAAWLAALDAARRGEAVPPATAAATPTPQDLAGAAGAAKKKAARRRPPGQGGGGAGGGEEDDNDGDGGAEAEAEAEAEAAEEARRRRGATAVAAAAEAAAAGGTATAAAAAVALQAQRRAELEGGGDSSRSSGGGGGGAGSGGAARSRTGTAGSGAAPAAAEAAADADEGPPEPLSVLRPEYGVAGRAQQEATLTRWADAVLSGSGTAAAAAGGAASGRRVTNLATDISDGVVLVRLCQALGGTEGAAVALIDAPQFSAHKMMNVNNALKFLRTRYQAQCEMEPSGCGPSPAPDFPAIENHLILNGATKSCADALWACAFVLVIAPVRFDAAGDDSTTPLLRGEAALRAWLEARLAHVQSRLPADVVSDAARDSWPTLLSRGTPLCAVMDSYGAPLTDATTGAATPLETLHVYEELGNLDTALRAATEAGCPAVVDADNVHHSGANASSALLQFALAWHAFR